ncbi:uncharacterized protein LOC144433835 isoform X2 [Glandiceps talaboti]
MDGNPDQNWQGHTQNGGPHETNQTDQKITQKNDNDDKFVTKENSEVSRNEEESNGPHEAVQNGGEAAPDGVQWIVISHADNANNQSSSDVHALKVGAIVAERYSDEETPLWEDESITPDPLDKDRGMQDGGVKLGHVLEGGSSEPGSKGNPTISQDDNAPVHLLENITQENPSEVHKLGKEFDIESLIEGNLGRDKSNTLMTPQELETMPDEGMEFEESVGPKNSGASSLNDSVCDSFTEIMNAGDSEQFENNDLSDSLEPVSNQVETTANTSSTTNKGQGATIYIVTTKSTRKEDGTIQRIVTINPADPRLVSNQGVLTLQGPSSSTQSSCSQTVTANQQVLTLSGSNSSITQATCAQTVPTAMAAHTNVVVTPSSESLLNTPVSEGLVTAPVSGGLVTTPPSDGLILMNEPSTAGQTPVVPTSGPPASVSAGVKSEAQEGIEPGKSDGNEMENEIPAGEDMTDEEEDEDDEDEDDDDGDDASGKVYFCPENGCGRKFNSKAKLKLHVSAHTGEARPFKCTFENCVWAFTTSYKLKRHYAKHTGEKPFKCPVGGCGKFYTTVYNLNSHMKIHLRPTTLFPCDVEGCGESFSTRRKLETHKRKHCDDKKFICDHPGCNKAFATSSALGSHVRSHQREEQIFPCTFEGCEKKFDKPCRLKLHLRSHTGERPYVCPFQGCEWAFTCLQKLTRHQRRHTGEKKYVCPEDGCGKAFTRAEHLKGHLVTHTGEKPFECPVTDCEAKFSARSSLYVHMKKHANTNDKSKEKEGFDCPVQGCHKVYASKASLKTHINRLHNINTVALEANQFGFIYINPEDLSGTTLENITGTGDGTPTVVRIAQVGQIGQVDQTADTSTFDLQVQPTAVTAVAAGQDNSFPQEGQFDDQNLDNATENVQDYLTTTDVDQPIVTATNLQPEVMAQHVGSNVVTQFVVNPDIASVSSVTQSQTPETTATSESPLQYTTRVFQANNSGAARTDYSAIQGLTVVQHRPVKRRKIFHNVPSPDSEKATDDEHSLDASEDSTNPTSPVFTTTAAVNSPAFTTTGVVMTSSAITLRDPATGSHYVQTQLLQDDPPSDQDIPFHPDISLPASSTSSDQSSISSELPVTILQEPQSNGDDDNPSETNVSDDYIETHSNSDSNVTPFTESTINLQDLA